MRSCRSVFLLVAVLFLGLACSEGKFRGSGKTGESVPLEHPKDQSQTDENNPRNIEGNPVDPEGNELPRPGKGINPDTGKVPTKNGYDPTKDPHSPYNPQSPNYNPDLPPYDPTEPYGPGTNPGGPGVNIYPPSGINEPGLGVPLYPGNPGYHNPYGPTGPYAPVLTPRVINVTCENGVNVVDEVQQSENQRIKAVVKGQLCPRNFNDTLVLFIVDFSASMGPHFDEDTRSENPGHDTPRADGSCGRLDAANQIINSVAGTNAKGVDVAMIPFAGDAIESSGIRPTAIERARRDINASKFCRYIPQSAKYDGPGSLKGTGVHPSTNYAAAFESAHQALRRSGKENAVIYFISDGEPTAPNNRQAALEAGIRKGLELRNDPGIRSLIINGLYLGLPGTETYKNAANVLSQVTGSPNRVLPVEKASQLADVITKFPSPTINLNTSEYRTMATIEVRPYKRENLGIQSLYELGPNLWEYQTQPFLLLGLPGKTVENTVNVSIIGENGFLYKTTVRIMYRML